MKTLLILLLIFTALIATQRLFFSFSSQKIADYADTAPKMDIRRHLSGPLVSEGVIYGPNGRVVTRFVADMTGTWDEDGGTLQESFRYADGGGQERLWRISFSGDGSFTGEADDIVGVARGEQAGAVAHLRYSIRLPESSGGHVLDASDWLYLMENGTIMNRSEMRKFGVKVAELVATIRPAP
ncbi:DUF3833 domain-containing protein [Defluviimonas sp. WL0002]|uniref:DUF3833 domain-containing protein n=1 Tax=Albidovulum marisflavi TaxID=2984159 RepID=A0ABT2ZGM5_9RHOB|nr:DUF3833 domain-containing protein [Defluviimonas sp. WL0002]MCV2870261.1 DUF3833 domain-containing protein [Defluviimonas sp. WL0002]